MKGVNKYNKEVMGAQEPNLSDYEAKKIYRAVLTTMLMSTGDIDEAISNAEKAVENFKKLFK